MYWYYKAPLAVVVLIVIVGIGFMVWKKLPDDVTGKVAETIQTPFSDTADEGTDADSATDSTTDSSDTVGDAPDGVYRSGGGEVGEQVLERLKAADRQLASDNPSAARALGMLVLEDAGVRQFDRDWYHAAEIVSRANTIFMNSDAPSPDRKAYTVQPGDTLSGIARKFNTTVGAIQRINGIDPTQATIFPGQVLYALVGEWSLYVSKSQFVLLLQKDQKLFKMYRVGIGRQNKTPVGTFEVATKVIHPDWTPPGKRIPYGDPANVLGTHWLGMKPIGGTDSTLRGYGIHGTWKPETVGKAVSAGCVRMVNEDVAELFDFVPEPGSQTRIGVVIEE